MGTYEPCVLGSDGNCTRWSHDHDADRPTSRADCGCDLSVGPNAVHIVDGHPDPRPSVTDNALAEAWAEGHRTGWEHCQDGNYGNDYWDDPTPNPYAAAARAETTTATVEDAARAIAAWALDFAGLGVGIYLNGETIGDPNGPWDVPTDAADSLAAWLNQRGLLATARTRPTRDDLARAIASGYEPDHPTPNRHDYRAADAVLALFRGGA